MTSNKIFYDLESQVQSYARTFPCIFKRARGSWLWDDQGRTYLDFLAGAGSINYGHNNPVLKHALLDYISHDLITHSLDLHTQAKKQFLEAMYDIILKPRGLDYVIQFTGPTGTNAVEAALKIARKVTGRSNIIAFTNAFHGVSTGALAITGNRYHRNGSGIPLSHVTRMPFDGYFGNKVDTIKYIERLLDDPSSGIDTPAAVIVETVQGEGGINVASIEWLQHLETLCQKRGILLIVDDIQAGCGRTGTFFSFEHARLNPDIITMSKSLSGYGLPLAVVLLKKSLDLWKPGEHNGTFRGNNHAFVTATAMINHFWRSKDFSQSVLEKGERLGERLECLVNRYSAHFVETRGWGMMRGICCTDPNRAKAIAARAFKNGLIVEQSGPYDEVIKCMMPLTTKKQEIDQGIDILEKACHEEFNQSLPKTSDRRSSHLQSVLNYRKCVG
jgi:diaminobutyrate-2-oxoglutarate transaminase